MLVFRDKLLPVRGLSKPITAFDAANLVYLASQLAGAQQNWMDKPWQQRLVRCNDFCLNK